MQMPDALDDLKAIRQIMERARRASDGFGGWFMVLWGAIWLVGFIGTHIFVRLERYAWINGLWMVLDTAGILGSVYLGIQMGRRARKASSILWLPFLLCWLALAAFDAVLIWKLRLHLRGLDMAFLIVLTLAVGYVQLGLFTHWSISAVGLFIGLLAIVAVTWLPEYFNLIIALLGGGAVIGTGLAALRYDGR